jgi:hypothetical protein
MRIWRRKCTSYCPNVLWKERNRYDAWYSAVKINSKERKNETELRREGKEGRK